MEVLLQKGWEKEKEDKIYFIGSSMKEILVLDLHTLKDVTEGPKITQAFREYTNVEVSTLKISSPEFSIEDLMSRPEKAIVLTGSDDPFLLKRPITRKLRASLRERISLGTCVFGICAGMEVLSLEYGYEIRQLRGEEREVGWPRVHLTDVGQRSPLFYRFPQIFRPSQFHDKTVVGVEEEKILARSDRYVQAISFESSVYGVQGHYEDSQKTGSEYLIRNSEKLSAQGIDVNKIISSRPTDYIEWQLFPNIVAIVRGV